MRISIYNIFCAGVLVLFVVSYFIKLLVHTTAGYSNLVFSPAVVNLSFLIGNFVVIPCAALYLLRRILKRR